MKSFRDWLKDLYFENREERFYWKDKELSLEEYFNRYKWWLRREYRYQQRKHDAQ
jgi:hypothetical protein